jgi:hypothetical protein
MRGDNILRLMADVVAEVRPELFGLNSSQREAWFHAVSADEFHQLEWALDSAIHVDMQRTDDSYVCRSEWPLADGWRVFLTVAIGSEATA